MRKLIISIISAAVLLPAPISAQQAEEEIQRSSSPVGLRIQDGNTSAATATNNSAPVTNTSNSGGRTSAVAGQGSINLQGKTKIEAQAKDVNAVTAGTQNRATNAVGNIGH